MAEQIGEAVYRLTLDNTQFDSKSQQSEKAFVASQNRIAQAGTRTNQILGNAAKEQANFQTKLAQAATQQEKAQRFLATLDSSVYVNGTKAAAVETTKAATATKTLSAEQKILNNGLRTSASQFAQQIPFARGMSSAFGAAAIAVPALATGILGAVLGFQILDSAVQHFTGSGLIDYLTGAAQAHRIAAEAAKLQGDATADLAILTKAGLSGQSAGAIELATVMDKAAGAQKRFNDEVARQNKILNEQGPPTAVPTATGTPIPGVSSVTVPPAALIAQQLFNAELDAAAKNLRDLLASGKISLNEFRAAASDPIFGTRFTGDLKNIDELLIKVGASIHAVADILRGARGDFSDALGSLTGSLGGADPVVEGLKLQVLLLEESKRRLDDLGDSDGAAKVKAQIDALNNAIAETEAPAAIAKQAILALGAATLQSAGDSIDQIEAAAKAYQSLADVVTKLPKEQVIEIGLNLNLSEKQAILDFIALLQQGITIPVAIASANLSASKFVPKADVPSGFLHDPTSLGIPAENQAAAAIDAASKAAADAAPNFEKQAATTKGAGAAAKEVSQIWADGIISLGEAMSEGLTPAMVAQLETTHDAEMAAFGLADAQFRLAVEQEKAANAGDGLQIALVQIATELIKSKRTLEEWNLDEVLRPKLESINSMINEIFSKPTKESLALELKKAQLERRKLLTERNGGDTKAIDAQITSISREIDLRNKDFEIAKLQTELKDQTLQSDQDLLNANQFLGTALESLSGSVKGTEDALGIRLFDAALHAASALQAVQAAGGTGFTAAEKHWINQVAINNGEPVPFPGFKWGLDFVPRDNMPALLHYGERVLTREQNQQMSEGSGVSIAVNGYGRSDEDILRVVNSATRTALRRARAGGAAALPSSYVPGR